MSSYRTILSQGEQEGRFFRRRRLRETKFRFRLRSRWRKQDLRPYGNVKACLIVSGRPAFDKSEMSKSKQPDGSGGDILKMM